MKKRLLLGILLTLLTAVYAHDYTIYPVDDQADILTNDQESALISKIYNTVDAHNGNLGIYIVTVPSYSAYGYSDVDTFSEDWYKSNKLGTEDSNTGLLLMLCMNEREYDICAYGSYSHTAFTDFGREKLAEAAVSYFKQDNWYSGFNAFVSKADKLLVMADEGNPLDVGTVYFDLEVLIQALIIAGSLSLITGLIVTLILRGKMNNVKEAKGALNYIDSNQIAFARKHDLFTHNVVTRTPINQNNSSGGGSRGGTTINGGGFSHTSGKF